MIFSIYYLLISIVHNIHTFITNHSLDDAMLPMSSNSNCTCRHSTVVTSDDDEAVSGACFLT
jgi:hypothetical protein